MLSRPIFNDERRVSRSARRVSPEREARRVGHAPIFGDALVEIAEGVVAGDRVSFISCLCVSGTLTNSHEAFRVERAADNKLRVVVAFIVDYVAVLTSRNLVVPNHDEDKKGELRTSEDRKFRQQFE